MNEVRFATTGFVTAEEKGPLSVSLVTPTELVIVDVLFGPSAAAWLKAGKPLGEVLGGLNSLQKAETRIPLSRLESICWIDREKGVRVMWLDESVRLHRKTTYISKPADRTQLLECLAVQLGSPLRVVATPAGIWKTAWSQLVGAMFSVVLCAAFLAMWDADAIGRAQGGNIALWLGPKGCALVGAAIFLACLISAWRRLSPRPMQHCWNLRCTKG
jgi:hypothetical protein